MTSSTDHDEGQRGMEHGWLTCELTFPEGLDHATGARLFSALSGLFRPMGKFGLGGLPTLVFELLSVPDGLHYLVSCPRADADVVRCRLTGVIPNLGITQVVSKHQLRDWRRVAALHRPEEGLLDADPKLIKVLLDSLRGLTPDQAAIVQFVMTPVGRPATATNEPAFTVSPRIAAAATTDNEASALLHRLQTAFRNLHMFEFPRLVSARDGCEQINERQRPRFEWRGILSPGSLAVVCGLPIDSPQVEGLRLGSSRQLAADAAVGRAGRKIMVSTAAGSERVLALAIEDRKRHLYVVGPSGRGKTTLLENLIVDDINEGFGVAYIDPKGDSVPRILDRIPDHRLDDVVLFDPADEDYSIGFNVLAGPSPYAVASQMVGLFDALTGLSAAPRAVNLFSTAVATLALGGYTLCEVPLLLDSGAVGAAFRAKVLPLAGHNRMLRAAWRGFEFAKPKDKEDQAAPILHRLNALLQDPRLYASLSQRQSGFTMAEVLAGNKILLVPLNEHDLGEQVRPLVGSLVAAKFWQAAQGRRGGRQRPYFWYVDEFDDMAAGSYQAMVARARGHDIGLVLAHQQPERLTKPLRADVFANVASKVIFQTTDDDHARILAKELGQPVTADDIKNLEAWQVLARLCAGGVSSRALSGRTLPLGEPAPYGDGWMGDEVRRRSLAKYARPMAAVMATTDEEVSVSAAKRLPRLD